MAEPKIAWKSDSRGYYLEMLVGERRDWSINWAEYLPAADPITSAVWGGPAGVTITNETVAGKVTQAYLRPTAAGDHQMVLTVVCGLEEKILPFYLAAK